MRLTKQILTMFIVVLLLFGLMGCGAMRQMIGLDDPLTLKEKGIIMLGSYRFQYEDYMRQAQRRDLTEPERDVLRIKKSIMTQVYPLIALYKQYVDEGVSDKVLRQLEFQISDLLNRVGSTLIKKLLSGGETWQEKTTQSKVYLLPAALSLSSSSFKPCLAHNG